VLGLNKLVKLSCLLFSLLSGACSPKINTALVEADPQQHPRLAVEAVLVHSSAINTSFLPSIVPVNTSFSPQHLQLVGVSEMVDPPDSICLKQNPMNFIYKKADSKAIYTVNPVKTPNFSARLANNYNEWDTSIDNLSPITISSTKKPITTQLTHRLDAVTDLPTETPSPIADRHEQVWVEKSPGSPPILGNAAPPDNSDIFLGIIIGGVILISLITFWWLSRWKKRQNSEVEFNETHYKDLATWAQTQIEEGSLEEVLDKLYTHLPKENLYFTQIEKLHNDFKNSKLKYRYNELDADTYYEVRNRITFKTLDLTKQLINS